VPRAVHIDLDPDPIWSIKRGDYKDLYHPDNLIAGKEDAGGCFGRGYHVLGPEVIDYIMDRIRLTADLCEGLQGFIVYNSFSGGTGSGLGSLIMERMSIDYAKKTRM
jgi:tubulin alpha